MAQMQPFLSSSGGSLRTRQKVDRIIKRVSVDSSSGSCLEEVPIERTLSCPARTKKNENEREYSDRPQVPNEECESGAESLTTSTSSLTCRSSDTVSTRAGRSRVVVVPTLPGCLETLERDSESCSSSESRSEQRAVPQSLLFLFFRQCRHLISDKIIPLVGNWTLMTNRRMLF